MACQVQGDRGRERCFDERSRSRSEDNPFWFCSPVMQYDVWWSPVRRVLVCYQPSWAIGPILALVAGHKGKSQSHTSGGRAQVYRTTALTSTEITRNTMSCSCLVLTWMGFMRSRQWISVSAAAEGGAMYVSRENSSKGCHTWWYFGEWKR